MKYVNFWKVCITEWTNVFKMTNMILQNHARVEDCFKDSYQKIPPPD